MQQLEELVIDYDPRLIPDICKKQYEDKYTIDYTYGNGPKGPVNWPMLFPTCGGKMQSPINIETSHLTPLSVGPLKWGDGHFNLPSSVTATIDDRTFTLEATWQKGGPRPIISGGPLLTYAYEFNNVHFHWGKCDSIGSEHTINGTAYPLEVHVVYTLLEDNICIIPKDNIVVVTYLLQISDKSNPSLDPILDAGEIAAKRLNTPIKLFNYPTLSGLAQPFYFDYMTYLGSLTTPLCDERVRFIISISPFGIGKSQMDRFRKIAKIAPGLRNNFRPVQPLNGRTVQFVAKKQ